MLTILRASRLIDGNDAAAVADAAVYVEGDQITYAGPAVNAPDTARGEEIETIDLGSATLMPGLIDCHAHPVRPPFVGDPWFAYKGQEHMRVLDATRELQAALLSGVTTFRDCGAPHDTAFALKRAVEMGIVPGPRLIISGPPICPTGGHMFLDGGEADGQDGVRKRARQLFKDGVDFLKLTATGGGTIGTARHHATFETKELRAAAREAALHDSYATAHCHAIEGILRCLEAGVQMLEHATFVAKDGLEHVDHDLVKRIADQGVTVVPTVSIHGRWVQEHAGTVNEMNPSEHAIWIRRSEGLKRRLEIVAILQRAGVEILMGSDGSAAREYPAALDDLAYSLVLHVEAGIPAMEVIRSATSAAADRIGIGAITGRIEPGKQADIIAVNGNPLVDIGVVEQVRFVMARGRIARRDTAR